MYLLYGITVWGHSAKDIQNDPCKRGLLDVLQP